MVIASGFSAGLIHFLFFASSASKPARTLMIKITPYKREVKAANRKQTSNPLIR